MFDNIGEKIKKLAYVVTIAGTVASVIGGLITISSDPIAGFLTMILGAALSWASSFVIYGFGELIENTKIAAHNTYAIYNLIKKDTPEEK